MSRQSKKQTVYFTCLESATFSLRRICLFSPLKSSVVIESNTNRNICSMENTKIKARRACKLLFTKKQAKKKRSWSVRRSPIHSLCVSHGYEPTPRLFRTRIALLCENDVALASPMVRSTGAGARKLFERIVRRRRDMQRLIPYRTGGMMARPASGHSCRPTSL